MISRSGTVSFCYTRLVGFLDLLFPKHCVNCKKLGSYLCSNCFAYLTFDVYQICIPCNRPSFDGLTHPGCRGRYTIDGAFSVLAYKGVVKKLLYTFKYRPYLADLKNVLTDLFFEGLIQKEGFDEAYQYKPAIVPIPLHPSRLRARGYNQAQVLAEGLSNKFSLRLVDLIIRVKRTLSQVGLKRKERIENLKDAFSPAFNVSVSEYPYIFLVDDVLTTGATLAEAARILKRHGAKKVWGATLAIDQ